MEVDPRSPLNREAILLRTRLICTSTAVFGVIFLALALTGWLILRSPWMLLTANGLVVVLAWEIYPHKGIRYRTGFLDGESAVRDLALGPLAKALQEQTPIQDWHRDYVDILRSPSDGSRTELVASLWIHRYAWLNGDLETAALYVNRVVALLPEDAPQSQYTCLGDALYFYTVIAPDEGTSDQLLLRIRNPHWELGSREPYIEAAIALAEGRRPDALAIAQARLDRIGHEVGTARIQLQRELLLRCRDRAR